MIQGIGMLWFDDREHQPIEIKIGRAAEYFQSKYGQRPTVCYVHPSMLIDEQLIVEDILVCISTTVLPNHFWLGTEENKEPVAA